jgi:hypothetical protein
MESLFVSMWLEEVEKSHLRSTSYMEEEEVEGALPKQLADTNRFRCSPPPKTVEINVFGWMDLDCE